MEPLYISVIQYFHVLPLFFNAFCSLLHRTGNLVLSDASLETILVENLMLHLVLVIKTGHPVFSDPWNQLNTMQRTILIMQDGG